MNRAVPFPFTQMFQNGPRRQGSAAPRKTSAALTAAGPFEDFPATRETQRLFLRLTTTSRLVGIELRELVWGRPNIVGGLKSTV